MVALLSLLLDWDWAVEVAFVVAMVLAVVVAAPEAGVVLLLFFMFCWWSATAALNDLDLSLLVALEVKVFMDFSPSLGMGAGCKLMAALSGLISN